MEMKLVPKFVMSQGESGRKQADLQSLLLKGPVAKKNNWKLLKITEKLSTNGRRFNHVKNIYMKVLSCK